MLATSLPRRSAATTASETTTFDLSLAMNPLSLHDAAASGESQRLSAVEWNAERHNRIKPRKCSGRSVSKQERPAIEWQWGCCRGRHRPSGPPPSECRRFGVLNGYKVTQGLLYLATIYERAERSQPLSQINELRTSAYQAGLMPVVGK
jgi:hypothetical protein